MSATSSDTCAAVLGSEGGGRLEVWLGFQRSHRALSRALEGRLAQRHGLSLSELELLSRLAADPEHRRRLSQLAAEIDLSLSRVSRIVDGLERRGAVKREPCPEDARATNARLTGPGLALAREAQAGHQQDVQSLFLDRLDEAQLRTLAVAFARLTP